LPQSEQGPYKVFLFSQVILFSADAAGHVSILGGPEGNLRHLASTKYSVYPDRPAMNGPVVVYGVDEALEPGTYVYIVEVDNAVGRVQSRGEGNCSLTALAFRN
jgi:hypothetical protein